MLRIFKSRKANAVLVATMLVLALLVPVSSVLAERPRTHVVTVPEEDRFDPFVMTIKAGDQVTWVNKDTDDHTIVSDDFFTNTSNRGINTLLPGTDSNGGIQDANGNFGTPMSGIIVVLPGHGDN